MKNIQSRKEFATIACAWLAGILIFAGVTLAPVIMRAATVGTIATAGGL